MERPEFADDFSVKGAMGRPIFKPTCHQTMTFKPCSPPIVAGSSGVPAMFPSTTFKSGGLPSHLWISMGKMEHLEHQTIG